jgi:dihydrodipicolinate synthase/N-acetylneuraminate lyase
MTKSLEGILVPLLTPFDTESGEVDDAALRRLIDRVLAAGVHGVIANAATGEFFHLLEHERRHVAEVVVEHVAGRVPVLVGAGAPGTLEATRWAEHAQSIAADGLLVMPPYYVPLPADAVIGHVAAISDSVDLPIMFYSNPGASQVLLGVDELERLIGRANVPWFKLSTGQIGQVPLIVDRMGDRVSVFEGWDPLAFPSMATGAVGWTAGPSNALPELIVELWKLTRVDKDLTRAAALNQALAPILDFMAKPTTFCSSLKEICGRRGYPLGKVRSPYAELSSAQLDELTVHLAALGIN